jgi:hypothetical protein
LLLPRVTDSLLAQQDKKLASKKEFPPTLLEPIAKETPLLYRKGRRAMTGLEIAEERESDTSRQRRRDERAAAALAAVDEALSVQAEEKLA